MKLARRLTRATAELAYTDTAPDGGPAVVFVHGAGVDHTMFAPQVTALTVHGYRVITWDLRGHGESTLTPGTRFTATDALADLGALLDACQADSVVLVGHSLGGNLAQAFTRAHDDRVAGLVVLGSTWNTGPLALLERGALRIAAPTLALVPARSLPGWMARASAVSPPVVARTKAVFARMPKRVFLDVWRSTVSFVEPDPGYRCPVPLALMRGARDRTGNIRTAMPRWARTEGIPEHVVPNAGHLLTWDAPEGTSHALLRVLDRWRSETPSAHRGEP